MTAWKDSRARSLPPNAVIAGRYEITKLLARGGMGEVYSANDQSLGRALALKRLRGETSHERAAEVNLRREFHALAQLRHPRIIEVYDYGVDAGVPYYTMELLDGRDLRDLSPLPYREACLHLRDIASSLALMHGRRLLHRDVSPRNVRRTSSGRCKLIDFGAMVPFGVQPNVSGTAPSVSPEAVQGASLDQRSDLYALGALAYFCLTGRHCYDATKLDELPDVWINPVVRVKQRVPEVPEALDDLVMSLLNLDPLMRPKSAAEVIEWLSAIGELEPDDAVSIARSFLTSSRVIGRTSVTEELGRRLQRAKEGRGSTVVIAGAAGSGKSRILADAALIAQTTGLSAVRVTARRQRGSAFALAQDLIASLAKTLPLEAANAGAGAILWPHAATLGDTQGVQAVPVEDSVEQRARAQQQLTDVVCQVARARPLLLAVDDLERADEFSVALITGLAHQAASLPLAIIVTETDGQTATSTAVSRALHEHAQLIRLGDLNLIATSALLRSMFDDVPNLEQLADWTFRVARGNPKQTIELAEHLLSRGLIRYVDGTWVLPTEDLHEVVPQTMAETWMQRIRSLSLPALSLAELLCVRRGGATAELCLAARAGEANAAEQLFAALDELVREGIVECAGDEYVFPQDALRKTLQATLSPQRAAAQHRRWADVLLAGDASNVDVRLEAGWHLTHTDDELRGADILAQVTPLLIEQGLAMQTAIPALEKTLEVYERRGRPLEESLRLRASLVLAGYLYDYRLARRYGSETLAMLSESSGMRLAKRLHRYVGGRLALWVALIAVSVRRSWLPAERRGPPVRAALQYYLRCAMGLIGVRATGFDSAGTREILEQLEPLADAPKSTSGRIIYLACKAIVLQSLGREGELNHAVRAALAALRAGRKSDMIESEYKSLLVGLLLVEAAAECYRERSQALARADALDQIGTRLAKAAALRVRMLYYLRRGDSERAERCRRSIDLHAIQGGHAWQVEWFVSPAEGMAAVAWSDMVMIRRALERMDRLVEDVPTLAPARDATRVAYAFRRGEHARAAELGERLVAAHPPQTLIGWGPSHAMLAMAFIETGRAAEAKTLCEKALAVLSDDDRAYFALYDALQVAYAMSLAVLGERERADAMLQELFEHRRSQGEHVILVGLYQYQARMARLLGDRAALVEALRSMRNAALSSGFPAVILLADRVAELRGNDGFLPLPFLPHDDLRDARAHGAEQTAVTAFLRNLDTPRDRTRHGLQMLAQCVAADQAFLFARVGGSLQLVAALSEAEVPAQLREHVIAALAAKLTSSIPLEVELQDGEHGLQRFQIALLPSDTDPNDIVGAVALRECDTLSERLPTNLIHDIGRVLAEDIRTERATALSRAGSI